MPAKLEDIFQTVASTYHEEVDNSSTVIKYFQDEVEMRSDIARDLGHALPARRNHQALRDLRCLVRLESRATRQKAGVADALKQDFGSCRSVQEESVIVIDFERSARGALTQAGQHLCKSHIRFCRG
jgi:hypothetical protein